MTTRVAIAFLLLLALAVGGCGGPRTSDLRGIYETAARLPDTQRNPVIVIPGVLGSRLVAERDGAPVVVWGAFSGEYANPQRPDGARLVALPMEEGKPLAALRDDVRADGALDRLKVSLLGLPVALDAYRHILATLGVGGYRDEELGLAGAVDYGDDHFTCFQFAYDWRRDNVENAQLLDAFIREKRAYVQAEFARRYDVHDADVRFDIVAHSMGGLLTRYFLRYGSADLASVAADAEAGRPVPWTGAAYVDRAILVGTPSAGSVHAFHQLVDGQRFAFFLPKYEAAVLGTMPSVYQLLPRPEHAAVRDENGRSIDNLDADVWERSGWGLADPGAATTLAWLRPDVDDPAARRRIALDHQRKCLARARDFFAALDRPAPRPAHIRLSLVAGDAEPTDAVMVAGPDHRIHVTERAPGDGTVLRTSALMDERVGRADPGPRLESPIDWSAVTFLFTDHLALTTDPIFTDNVLYELLMAPPVSR